MVGASFNITFGLIYLTDWAFQLQLVRLGIPQCAKAGVIILRGTQITPLPLYNFLLLVFGFSVATFCFRFATIKKAAPEGAAKSLKSLVAGVGFEPTTFRL